MGAKKIYSFFKETLEKGRAPYSEIPSSMKSESIGLVMACVVQFRSLSKFLLTRSFLTMTQELLGDTTFFLYIKVIDLFLFILL